MGEKPLRELLGEAQRGRDLTVLIPHSGALGIFGALGVVLVGAARGASGSDVLIGLAGVTVGALLLRALHERRR